MVKAAEELVERVQELFEEKLEKACPEAWKSQCEEDAHEEAGRVIHNAAGAIHKEYASCDLRCEKLENFVKALCESTESLAKEIQKLKKASLGETDLDAITSARQAREGQEANQAVVGALAEQVHTPREEVAALKRAGAGEGLNSGKHGGGESKGEDEATRPNDEMTKSASASDSASDSAKRKEIEHWYQLFAQAVSPAPGWTIGDAGTSNRLQSWGTVVTTLSALG